MAKSRSNIAFILDGKVREIDFDDDPRIRPTTTVLNFLRSLPGHRGTKEGCAEGDCGACTVVLAAPNGNGQIEYKACDSCLIFLPMIDGKQLITVENVGGSENLHPVQTAMIETDGSQCGYCTPGFIMSMFAMYKGKDSPSRAEIDDALTGNLCRCTGYRPIVEATAIACTHNGKDQFTAGVPETLTALANLDARSETFQCVSSDQKYLRPSKLKEALALRKEMPSAKIVSGATDLGLLVTKQKQIIPEVIDISGLKEIVGIREEGDTYWIGAGTSLEDVKAFSQDKYPALYDMLAVFGSVQIRNLATLGGNLANASPIGDTPPVLMAYDATIVVASVDGTRELKALDFVTGYRETLLKDHELITGIRIPRHENGTIVRSYKISKRKDLDISTVSGAFRLHLSAAKEVEDIWLIYGGMAAMTKRASKAEEFLRGKSWTREIVETAMDLIEDEFTPISDARAGKEGRRVMARNLLLKFWSDTGAE